MKIINDIQVSIIVPNYNHGKYIKQRLDSIINQTFTDYELILLDDYSSDESRDILLSYKCIFRSIPVHIPVAYKA